VVTGRTDQRKKVDRFKPLEKQRTGASMPSVITADRRQREGSKPPSGGQGQNKEKGRGLEEEKGKKRMNLIRL
jgi:hypothetical protein